jgi:hypothetical protein
MAALLTFWTQGLGSVGAIAVAGRVDPVVAIMLAFLNPWSACGL